MDIRESLAARDYFTYYHPGLNRGTEDPVNSRLNYGYAVVRSTIDIMCESLKRCYLENDFSKLKLPIVLKVEEMELVNE